MTVQTFNTDLFSWHKDTKEFTAEASTLMRGPFLIGALDGAPDFGFNMFSDRTGNVETVKLVNHEEDREGDITMWIFKPRDKNLGFTVKVFND